MAQLLPKNFGKNLLFHKNVMRTEYKKGMQRLRFLAEERHNQYRQEFIEYTRKKIQENEKKTKEFSKKLSAIIEKTQNKTTLLDMGFDKARQQLAEAKKEKQMQVRIQHQKMKEIENKARREWLMEMNDHCHKWNRSPEEMKFAQYRLLNKKIFERLPKNKNYVLDRSENPTSSVDAFESNIDGYTGPLRSNTQRLAFVLANGTKLPIDKVEDLEYLPDKQLSSIELDKNSAEYKEYLEYLEFNKANEAVHRQQTEKRAKRDLAIHRQKLEAGIKDMNLELASGSDAQIKKLGVNVTNAAGAAIEHYDFDMENLTEDYPEESPESAQEMIDYYNNVAGANVSEADRIQMLRTIKKVTRDQLSLKENDLGEDEDFGENLDIFEESDLPEDLEAADQEGEINIKREAEQFPDHYLKAEFPEFAKMSDKEFEDFIDDNFDIDMEKLRSQAGDVESAESSQFVRPDRFAKLDGIDLDRLSDEEIQQLALDCGVDELIGEEEQDIEDYSPSTEDVIGENDNDIDDDSDILIIKPDDHEK